AHGLTGAGNGRRFDGQPDPVGAATGRYRLVRAGRLSLPGRREPRYRGALRDARPDRGCGEHGLSDPARAGRRGRLVLPWSPAEAPGRLLPSLERRHRGRRRSRSPPALSVAVARGVAVALAGGTLRRVSERTSWLDDPRLARRLSRLTWVVLVTAFVL